MVILPSSIWIVMPMYVMFHTWRQLELSSPLKIACAVAKKQPTKEKK
jgi:hypothetical protein